MLAPKQFWRKKIIFFHPFESINFQSAGFLAFKEKRWSIVTALINALSKQGLVQFLVFTYPRNRRFFLDYLFNYLFSVSVNSSFEYYLYYCFGIKGRVGLLIPLGSMDLLMINCFKGHYNKILTNFFLITTRKLPYDFEEVNK